MRRETRISCDNSRREEQCGRRLEEIQKWEGMQRRGNSQEVEVRDTVGSFGEEVKCDEAVG